LRRRRPAQADVDREDRHRPRRRDDRDGRAFRGDEGTARRLLPGRRRVGGRGDRMGSQDPVCAVRTGRGAPARAGAGRDVGMKVLALIYADQGRWESLSEDERNEVYERYRAFGDNVGDKIVDGAELAPTRAATTVRIREGQTAVTDGPFAETKEQLGGFYLLECASLDEAVELAAQIPGASRGAVELRAASEEAAA